MWYVVVLNGVAQESIAEFNPDFPDTPIERRYSADFLKKTIKSKTEISSGCLYNTHTGAFTEPLTEGGAN